MSSGKYFILIIPVVAVIAWLGYLVIQKFNTISDAQAEVALDTLQYDETDYQNMQAYFLADSVSMRSLDQKIESGDDEAIRLRALLTTPYQNRYSKATEKEIKALVLSYGVMSRVLSRFKKIDDQVKELTTPKTSEDSMIARYADSLKAIMVKEGKLPPEALEGSIFAVDTINSNVP